MDAAKGEAVSDTPYGRIIKATAALVSLPDEDNRISRSRVVDEVMRIKAESYLLERENADLTAKLARIEQVGERPESSSPGPDDFTDGWNAAIQAIREAKEEQRNG